jgi:flagellar basal-body rod modification protein FlgD
MMDPVLPTTSPSTPQTQTQGTGGALGKNDFLRLLVAQLSNQDPLNPMDGTQFVSQLAQFSSVEQLTNLSDSVAQMALAQTASIGAQAVNFVGHSVLAKGSNFHLDGSNGATLGVVLPSNAASVKVTVYDASGKAVATRQVGPLQKGQPTFSFDGLGDDGNALPAGDYTFQVSATDGAGKPINASPLSRGVVQGVSYANGAPTLRVDGHDVSMGSVVEVGQ